MDLCAHSRHGKMPVELCSKAGLPPETGSSHLHSGGYGWPGVLVHAWDSRTWGPKLGDGDLRPGLTITQEFKNTLGYMRPYQKIK